jgi:hypothetical protein
MNKLMLEAIKKARKSLNQWVVVDGGNVESTEVIRYCGNGRFEVVYEGIDCDNYGRMYSKNYGFYSQEDLLFY